LNISLAPDPDDGKRVPLTISKVQFDDRDGRLQSRLATMRQTTSAQCEHRRSGVSLLTETQPSSIKD
jgi:hypothetical protein